MFKFNMQTSIGSDKLRLRSASKDKTRKCLLDDP